MHARIDIMHALPPEFRRIRLELARERGHPEGSRATGYELVAPLDHNHRLSDELWRGYRDNCRVRRFREGEDDQMGHLARRPGGWWYFDYDPESSSDDEAGYRLGDERFVSGEYVSIADEAGHMHTYRVVSVQPI
jgi:hypothetical protein